MRRGLFIASDEVAAYMESIFADRIQKREAHLRWAAEVTQTINFDTKLEQQQVPPAWGSEPSLQSYSSNVQASPHALAARPPPRPAAGMPPAPQASIAEHFNRPGAPAGDTVRPPPKMPPVPIAPDRIQPVITTQRGGGGVLSSTQQTAAASPKAKPGANREAHPAVDEPPTLRASVRGNAPAGQAPIVPVLHDVGEEEEDNDDTIITSGRPDFSEAAAAARAAPLPAAGRPAAPPPPPPRRSTPPPAPIATATPAMPFAVAAPAQNMKPRPPTQPPAPPVLAPPGGLVEQGPQGPLNQTRTAIGESPFQQPLLQRSGSMSGELPDPMAAARAHAAVEAQRLFAPPVRGQLPTTAATARPQLPALLAGVPLWAVAGVSAFLALVSFAVFLFVLAKMTG